MISSEELVGALAVIGDLKLELSRVQSENEQLRKALAAKEPESNGQKPSLTLDPK